jgi:hypothetical protein
MSSQLGMNGSNGGAHAAPMQSVQINPIDIANAMLTFLHRVEFRASERVAFDQCEMVLQAMRTGRIVLANAPEPQTNLPLEQEPAGG